MASRSPFFAEWIQSLREHYMNVIRTEDTITEQSLIQVMQEVGFSEDEIRELKIRATMHVDEVSEDFVPDVELLKQQRATPHPAECACPDCMAIDLAGHDDEGQPLEHIEEEGEAGSVFPVVKMDETIAEELPDNAPADAYDETLVYADEGADIETLDDLPLADDAEDEDDDSPQQLTMF